MSALISQLIESLRILPGVGPKSAQRMSYYLLERNRAGGKNLAYALTEALEKVGNCDLCRTLTEEETCNICNSAKRDHSQLCVVETPADVLSIEQAGIYQGLYFVLLGRLSPIDGISPKELGLDKLKERLGEGDVSEIILATNPTVEGEVTAHYLQQMAQEQNIQVTRLAQGLPTGSELEYLDSMTLQHAFSNRR